MIEHTQLDPKKLLAWLIKPEHGGRLVTDQTIRDESEHLALVTMIDGEGDEVFSSAPNGERLGS